MKQTQIWACAPLAMLLVAAGLLGGCGSRVVERNTILITPDAVQAASAPRRSAYHFEAERAAMDQAGCVGPNKIRPISRLTHQQGSLEWFEVICAERIQRVRCDMGMCVPIR